MTTRNYSQAGLTLLEVLVVFCLVVATLGTGVALAKHLELRKQARRSQCKNGLKNLAIALHNYHEVTGMQFPTEPQPPLKNP